MNTKEKVLVTQYFLSWCMRLDSEIEQQLSKYLLAKSLSEKQMHLCSLRDLTERKEILCKICNDLHALLEFPRG